MPRRQNHNLRLKSTDAIALRFKFAQGSPFNSLRHPFELAIFEWRIRPCRLMHDEEFDTVPAREFLQARVKITGKLRPEYGYSQIEPLLAML
jgi:hypothetical protein